MDDADSYIRVFVCAMQLVEEASISEILVKQIHLEPIDLAASLAPLISMTKTSEMMGQI